MANDNVAASSGIGFAGLLTIVFIVLKLTGTIAWSWWWVLSPLWIPTVLLIAIFLAIFLVILLFYIVKAWIDDLN